MTREQQEALRAVKFASRACMGYGCMAADDEGIAPVCLSEGCSAREYSTKSSAGKVGDGFPGMSGDLASKKPTEAKDAD
jgi:hypothetical protein